MWEAQYQTDPLRPGAPPCTTILLSHREKLNNYRTVLYTEGRKGAIVVVLCVSAARRENGINAVNSDECFSCASPLWGDDSWISGYVGDLLPIETRRKGANYCTSAQNAWMQQDVSSGLALILGRNSSTVSVCY